MIQSEVCDEQMLQMGYLLMLSTARPKGREFSNSTRWTDLAVKPPYSVTASGGGPQYVCLHPNLQQTCHTFASANLGGGLALRTMEMQNISESETAVSADCERAATAAAMSTHEPMFVSDTLWFWLLLLGSWSSRIVGYCA